jgi:hypothetical protein
MATYYLSTTGSNSNSGTSTSNAWLTLTYALGATSGFASGDTLWIAAGVYRGTTTVGMTSPTAATYIKGDFDGAIFGTSGEVRITGYTTNDDTAASASDTINTSSRNYLNFYGLRIESGNANGYAVRVATSRFCVFDKCVITSPGANCCRLEAPQNNTGSHIVKNSVIIGRSAPIQIVATAPTTGNQDVDIAVENCYLQTQTNQSVFINSTGTTGTLSGVRVTNCTCWGGTAGIQVNTSAWRSTTASVTIRNTFITCAGTSIAANTLGQIDEDYNRLGGFTTQRNLTNAGANTLEGVNLSLDFGACTLFRTPNRPFWMPYVSGTISGDGTSTGAPATDMYGYTRPSPPAIGPAEDNPISAGLAANPLGGYVG